MNPTGMTRPAHSPAERRTIAGVAFLLALGIPPDPPPRRDSARPVLRGRRLRVLCPVRRAGCRRPPVSGERLPAGGPAPGRVRLFAPALAVAATRLRARRLRPHRPGRRAPGPGPDPAGRRLGRGWSRSSPSPSGGEAFGNLCCLHFALGALVVVNLLEIRHPPPAARPSAAAPRWRWPFSSGPSALLLAAPSVWHAFAWRRHRGAWWMLAGLWAAGAIQVAVMVASTRQAAGWPHLGASLSPCLPTLWPRAFPRLVRRRAQFDRGVGGAGPGGPGVRRPVRRRWPRSIARRRPPCSSPRAPCSCSAASPARAGPTPTAAASVTSTCLSPWCCGRPAGLRPEPPAGSAEGLAGTPGARHCRLRAAPVAAAALARL